jgi:hypothetical protein
MNLGIAQVRTDLTDLGEIWSEKDFLKERKQSIKLLDRKLL